MMKVFAPVLLIGMLFIAGCDQKESLSHEQGEAILAELKTMNAKLEEMAKAQPANRQARPAKSNKISMEVKGGHRMGDPKAPLVLVEFFDYECPYCKRFADNTLPELKRDYIDTGKLLYIAQDLPLHFHKQARLAAIAAHCAAEQDKFWDYRDRMVVNIRQLKKPDLIGYAKELGLKEKPFTTCLDEERYASEVDKSSELAKSLGVTGTPTFVLANNTGQKISGTKMVGAQPAKAFAVKIDALLKDQAKAKAQAAQ